MIKSGNAFVGYVGALIGELITPQSNLCNAEQLWQEFSATRPAVMATLQAEQEQAPRWMQVIDGLESFEQILPFLNSDRFAVREYATAALANLSTSEIVSAMFREHWNHESPEIRLRVRTAYGLHRFHNLPAVLQDRELAGLLDLTPELLQRVYSDIAQAVKTNTFATAESRIAEDLKVVLQKVSRLELIQDRFAEIRQLGLANHWYGKQLSHSYLTATANGFEDDIANLNAQFNLYRKVLYENLQSAEPQEPSQVVDLVVKAKEFSKGMRGEYRLSKEAEEILSVANKDLAEEIDAFLIALKEEDPAQILKIAPRLAEYEQQVVKPLCGSAYISVDWKVGKETMLKLMLALNDQRNSDVDYYSKVIETSRRYVLNSTDRETIYKDAITELFWFYHSIGDLDDAQRAIHARHIAKVIDETLVLGTSSGKFRAAPIQKLRKEYELLLANNDQERALAVLLKVSAYILAESRLVDLQISRESKAAILFQQAVEQASLKAGEATLGKDLEDALGKAWALRNDLHQKVPQRIETEPPFIGQHAVGKLSAPESEKIANALEAVLLSQQQQSQN